MRYSRSDKYKNYGPIPQNEYTTAKLEKSTDTAVVLEDELEANDMAYRQSLIKRQSQHPSGRRIIRGWSRTWKANGWRAEAAALQDEFTGMRRHSGHVRKSSHHL